MAKDDTIKPSVSAQEQASAAPAATGDFATQSIGAYGGAANAQPDLSTQSWEKAGRTPWAATTKGRIAIRTFSRGVMGSAFYAVGSALTHKCMKSDYMHPDGRLEHIEYDQNMGLFEQRNPLQFIAKLIDSTAGKAIKTGVFVATGDRQFAERSVQFRPTKFSRDFQIHGRSLGEEAVFATFDFFSASVGDAWGRDIAGWFDPAVKKSWLKKDGSIDVPEAIHSALTSARHYITYNGGEDWFAAIPYVYYMQASRHVLDHMAPGFMNDPDRNLNGGSFRVGRYGTVLGNYNGAGIADLQGRFTVYNMFTLMYRELYAHVKDKLEGKPTALYGAPDQDTNKNVLEKTADVFKWMARSVVKAGIFMTPSVPFFWITRTPQTKYRGVLIYPEHGVMAYKNEKKGRVDIVTVNNPVPAGTEVFFSKFDPHGKHDHLLEIGGIRGGYRDQFVMTHHHPVEQYSQTHMNAALKGSQFDPYGQSFGPGDYVLNKVGKANDVVAKKAQGIAEKVAQTEFGKGIERALDNKLTSAARTFVDSSISYTPYMIAKAEFAKMFDDGQMDMAIERMIDGAVAFKWGEFKAGAHEVFNSILHKPLEDPAREAEGKRRVQLDSSLSAGINLEYADIVRPTRISTRIERADLPWQERVISKPDTPAVEKTERPSDATHAKQEELRKVLKDTTPPTNSIN